MQSGIAAAVSATHTASTSFMGKSALQPNEMKRGRGEEVWKELEEM